MSTNVYDRCDQQERRIQALQDRISALEILREKDAAKIADLVAALDDKNGTPCEQIRHQQEVERLTSALQDCDYNLQARDFDIEAKDRRIKEADDEIERLREALRPMTEGTYWLTDEHVRKAREALGDEKDAEIERLREEIRLHVSVKDKRQAEIERLRQQLESEAYSTEEAINKRDAEIERLRDTLRHVVFNPLDYDAGRVNEALAEAHQ